MPSVETLLNVGMGLVMAAVGTLVWSFRSVFYVGQQVEQVANRLDRIVERVTDCEDRHDYVEQRFVKKDGGEMARIETWREHQAKQITELWTHINELRRRRE